MGQSAELKAPRADALDSALAAHSDAQLVEAVRQGDPDAFGPLVERYERKVMRVAWRFLHERGAVEDVSQEAFLKAYKQLGDFDASRRFGPWLFRITVNLCLDALRKRKRRGPTVPLESAAEPTGPAATPLDGLERGELREQVRHLVDALPLKYRTVLVLRDLEGFSCSEVAAIVRSPEATVRWRLSRARRLFRQRWEQYTSERGPAEAG